MADGFLLVGFRYEFADLFRGCGVCVGFVYYAGVVFCGVGVVCLVLVDLGWEVGLPGLRFGLDFAVVLVTKQFAYGLVGAM